MITYTLKVHDIRLETDDAITLCFNQPSLRKVKYLAGQYLTLIFRINGRRYIRPYSFSSSPHTDKHLEITIKRVLNGVVSNHIIDNVKIGDVIEVLPPMGDFTFNFDGNHKNVYLWGVGSGITPLISLAKDILIRGAEKVFLLYGNRTSKSSIFYNQIILLEETYRDRFFVKHFHTQSVVDENNPNHVLGRIDRQRALSIMENDPEISSSVHYICGPAGLKESVKQALYVHNVDVKNIFSEDFELVKNPKDFENIFTQNVRMSFNEQEYILEVIKGKSILEAALDANIELPYSCQTGNCSTCKANVIHGEVRMIGLSQKREDLEEGEYLLCCTHPLTDNVHIEI